MLLMVVEQEDVFRRVTSLRVCAIHDRVPHKHFGIIRPVAAVRVAVDGLASVSMNAC